MVSACIHSNLAKSRGLSYAGETGPTPSKVQNENRYAESTTVKGSHVHLLPNDGTHCFTNQSVTVKCSSELFLRVTGVWTIYRKRVKQYFQRSKIYGVVTVSCINK